MRNWRVIVHRLTVKAGGELFSVHEIPTEGHHTSFNQPPFPAETLTTPAEAH